MKKVGILLIIIGLALTVFTAVTFYTKKKVVDIGKIEITTNKPHSINWSPLMGIAIMMVGGVIVLIPNKK
jgi:hypothetical protein